MSPRHNAVEIERAGLRFAVDVERDNSMGAPWEEHDGHGIVSRWERRAKKPGERVLIEERDVSRFYDVDATLKVARRDQWGLSDEHLAALVARLGRTPSPREVTAEAVEQDYRCLRAWCRDEWYWVTVVVTLLDVNGARTHERESLGGIESSSGEYLNVVAAELAEEIAQRIGDARELTRVTKIRNDAPSRGER